MNSKRKDRLYYYGTDIEVKKGDRIELKSLVLRRKLLGRVACVPEKTGRELAREKKNPENCLIELTGGKVTGWLYSPEDLQPPKRLVFLGRGDDEYNGITNEELEKEELENEGVYWLDLGTVTIILLVVIVVIAVLAN